MTSVAAPLAASLALSRDLLAAARPFGGMGRTLSGLDALEIDIPAYHGGLGARLDAPALRTLASLYFCAEIEGTYLMAVAEELAQARFTLNLGDMEAARQLEDFATAMRRDWVPRDVRNQIYARVFGLGYADPALGDAMINQAFEPQFARVAQGLAAVLIGPPMQTSTIGASARLSLSFSGLASVLSPKLQGNTLIITERLTAQLEQAVTVLNAPALARLFMGQTAWDVVRGVLGDDLPDLSRAVTRAQTGMRILAALADVAPALHAGGGADLAARLAAQPSLADWALMWLEASGLPAQDHAAPAYGTYGGGWRQ